jgi:hypothetical protein
LEDVSASLDNEQRYTICVLYSGFFDADFEPLIYYHNSKMFPEILLVAYSWACSEETRIRNHIKHLLYHILPVDARDISLNWTLENALKSSPLRNEIALPD